jgi:hypothetical protein
MILSGFRVTICCFSANGDQISKVLQLHRTNPRYVDEIIDAGKGAVRFSVFDDLLGQTGADSGKKIQFRRRGCVDIGQLARIGGVGIGRG